MSPREYDDGGHHTSVNKPETDRKQGQDPDRKPGPKQEQEPPAPPPKPPRRRLALYVVLPLALLVGWGVYVHWRQSSDASDTLKHAQASVPDVQVASAHRTSSLTATSLPGQTAAFESADLFARATGYVTQRMVDIGSHVKKGDLLLVIASPDLDQQLEQAQAQLGQMQAQLEQAKASLGQANANTKLALVNRNRSQILAGEGWDTKQNRDTQVTNYNVSSTGVKSAQAGIGVAVANVRAQQASVDRLVALTGFENVKAPFDGVITQRDVDIGNLVQSDSSTGTALLHIDQQDLLRCQVYVPQSQFTGIHAGLPAHVTIPELPGQVFKAVVSRSSVSLAQNSRSMLVEVDIDNRDGHLTPGLFVTVAFDVTRPAPVVVVPDAALIFDASGLHVAVVGQDSKVAMRTISIARDTGTEAELREGLDGTEKVIVNPPTDLSEGQKVHVLPEKKEGKQASG
ncbi:efflux RND transporter periplasmic adaptor subunit [Lichenicola cladoniae]|uniref:Efflux RND transporter periplasmic adaptor subunit n=1 Tax=Lichenicola cladoniae TaxID=1484109 RepID=A0A6M8HTE3_9PROT|nr:efflux RND transporter periplasmic adaptor subunit [Lichenicola cladoniae]NPD65372.1 efflux RND transporter periplasmic adaptor subunit [Acetobacteraceae bacterium]QKE91546.1 efflux RND transporter periplasmic adaptor subunit [Lichenicola cladoniae]